MPFGKDQAGIGEAAIGVIWLVNTLVIVALQMPISRLAEGRRRMRALAAMRATWAMAWLIVEAVPGWSWRVRPALGGSNVAACVVP